MLELFRPNRLQIILSETAVFRFTVFGVCVDLIPLHYVGLCHGSWLHRFWVAKCSRCPTHPRSDAWPLFHQACKMGNYFPTSAWPTYGVLSFLWIPHSSKGLNQSLSHHQPPLFMKALFHSTICCLLSISVHGLLLSARILWRRLIHLVG